MAEILRIVGTIAGIGGISLGIVLLIFKDFIRDFIQARVFKTLSSGQATILMGATIIFTFSIAIIGIFAGFIQDGGPIFFILLVSILLVFILSVLFTVTRQMNLSDGQPEIREPSVFFKVYNHLENSKFEDAEKELAKVIYLQDGSAEFWYWKSRIAFALRNERVASAYVKEALKREPRHVHSLALQIKLLLLSGSRNDRTIAKELAENSKGISHNLDVWLNCLKAEGMFSQGPRSNHELDKECAFPAHNWNKE